MNKAIESQVKVLQGLVGQTVLHFATMTFGEIKEVFPDGYWTDGERQFLNAAKPWPVDLDPAKKLTHIPAPALTLTNGHTFLILPNAFGHIGPEVRNLYATLVDTLKVVSTGFAVSARTLGLTSSSSIMILRGALYEQLRTLDAASQASTSVPDAMG